MANIGIHIDSAAVVVQTNRLEKMGKGALAKAVRNTLNSAAYDVKTKTMPAGAKKAFVERRPQFFKAMSKVTPAQGNDIKTMQAVVGFVPPASDKGHAVADLKQQEESGAIENRAFIPLAAARVGNSWRRGVRQENRMSAINNRMSVGTRSSIVDSLENATGRNKQEKFVRSAIAAGKGGFVIGTDRKKGARMLLRINSVKTLRKGIKTKAGKQYHGGDTVVNSTAIYSVKARRAVRVKATGFMKKASMVSAAKMEGMFAIQAKKILK